ncbi:hypothetical protein ACLKA6_010462 [Drosophila palustris]
MFKARNVKKRKLERPTPESDKVIGVLETMIAKQETILQRPEPTPLRSIVRYWDERLNEMSQEEAEAAEQEMTQTSTNRIARYDTTMQHGVASYRMQAF